MAMATVEKKSKSHQPIRENAPTRLDLQSVMTAARIAVTSTREKPSFNSCVDHKMLEGQRPMSHPARTEAFSEAKFRVNWMDNQI